MTNLTAAVDQSFTQAGDDLVIDQETLDRFMERLLGADFTQPTAVFYTDAVLRAFGEDPSELQARSGGWTIHVRRGIAQSAITGVVMALVLKAMAVTPISLAVIPAILPCLFQIDKTQLTMKDEELLLRLYKVAETEGLTADDLYEKLPQEIREQVNRLDLLEFLDAVTKTGHATEVTRGVFQLRHPDYPRFVLNIA
jgi:hypothetical protein